MPCDESAVWKKGACTTALVKHLRCLNLAIVGRHSCFEVHVVEKAVGPTTPSPPHSPERHELAG
eukprot:2643281-Amphidinium_carterae.1